MNSKKLFFLFLASSLLFVKCETSLNEPIDEDIVPQIDIPWPSLGNVSWPMHHHDPQSTGRSKYSGPQNGILAKKVYVGTSESGIAIGYNRTIYVSTSYWPAEFFALDYEGDVKWKSSFLSYTTPLINSDSVVYAAGERAFFAFNQKGDTLWKNTLNYEDRIVSVSINIDKNGNLYYVDYNHKLTVLDKNGNLKWKLKDTRFLNWTDAAPAFSPDGKTLYVQGISVSVLAIDISSRSIKWTFGDKQLSSSPVIDNAGNLYIIPEAEGSSTNRKFYSINSEGQINWSFSFISIKFLDNTEPTIDYNGNIYFGSDTLYSFSNKGKIRWKKSLNGRRIISPLICDNNNVVYVGTSNPQFRENKIIAIKDSGEIKWEIIDVVERALGVSPAITEDGSLLYPTWNNEKGNYLIIK